MSECEVCFEGEGHHVVGCPNIEELNHEGFKTDRLGHEGISVREKSFHDEWIKQNERHSFLNFGGITLESVVKDPTQRDASVAAGVIQWLGTSCGQAFLHEVDCNYNRKNTNLR